MNGPNGSPTLAEAMHGVFGLFGQDPFEAIMRPGVAEAVERSGRIRALVDVDFLAAIPLMGEAYRAGDWKALDYSSYQMYAANELHIASMPRRPATDSRSVYFIQAGGPTAAVKIGVSGDVAARLAQMQTGSPDALVLLAQTPSGGQRLEALLHRRFEHLRLRGEWFMADPDLLAFIGDLTKLIGLGLSLDDFLEQVGAVA